MGFYGVKLFVCTMKKNPMINNYRYCRASNSCPLDMFFFTMDAHFRVNLNRYSLVLMEVYKILEIDRR